MMLAATTAGIMVTAARPVSHWPATTTPHLAKTKTAVHHITMVTATIGWGLSTMRQILRTTNGGQSWTIVSTAHPHAAFLATSFPSPEHAVMVGVAHDGRQWLVWTTANGGHTWHTAFLALPQGGQISDATVQSSWDSRERGWLVIPVNMPAKSGQDRLYRTTDGGATWHLINANLPYSDNAGVVFNQSQVGWLPLHTDSLRNLKFLATTKNGGKTWQRIALPVPPLLAPHVSNLKEDYSPSPVGLPVFANPQLGAMLTTYGALNANGTQKPGYSVVYVTTDGGSHWQWTVLPPESQNATNSPSTVAWQSTPQGWILNVRTFTQKIIAQWDVP
jgi:photosystem II stability/assembly factor-like uncharacterized protein